VIKLLLTTIAIILLLSCTPAEAVIKYVDNAIGPASCSNYDRTSRSCGSGSFQAWKTIVGASRNTNLGPNDVLRIVGGSPYVENDIHIRSDTAQGSFMNHAIIEGDPGAPRPIVRPATGSTFNLVWNYFGDFTGHNLFITTRFIEIDMSNLATGVNGNKNACIYGGGSQLILDDVIMRNCNHDGMSVFSPRIVIRNSQILACGRNPYADLYPGNPEDSDTKGFGLYIAPNGQGADTGNTQILIENNVIDGCRGGGMVMNYSQQGTIIRNNKIKNVGIYTTWGRPPSDPSVGVYGAWRIRAYCISAGGNQFGAGGPRDFEVYNNTCENVRGDDLNDLSGRIFNVWGTSNGKFHNNTAINADVAWFFNLNPYGSNSNIDVFNNIFDVTWVMATFQHPSNLPDDTGSTHDFDFRNNLFRSGTTLSNKNSGGITWNITASQFFSSLASVFVNPSSGSDWRLVTGSPAINNGTDTSPTVTLDSFNGTRTVPYDIGIHEFDSGGDPPPVDPPAPDPMLVVQISCDNAVTDSSGNLNHGALTNGASYSSLANGKYNQACSLDGVDDHVLVSNSASIGTMTHGFSLEAWVFPAVAMTSFKGIIVNDTVYLYASSDGYCGPGGILAGFFAGGAPVSTCYSTPLTPSIWTHLAATYNRTLALVTLYVNGIPVTSSGGSALLSASASSLFIGASPYPSENFSGLVDEPKIFNYARTQLEIGTDKDTSINPIVPATSYTFFRGKNSAGSIGKNSTFRLRN
jgi:hypothetical protein